MIRGLPPPQVIIIHRRQVVVDQAHRVDHLERHGRRHRGLLRPAEHLARREAQHGADALPPRHEGVRHRLAYLVGLGDLRLDRRLERGLDGPLLREEVAVEVERRRRGGDGERRVGP